MLRRCSRSATSIGSEEACSHFLECGLECGFYQNQQGAAPTVLHEFLWALAGPANFMKSFLAICMPKITRGFSAFMIILQIGRVRNQTMVSVSEQSIDRSWLCTR
jgi:hypothetical protein